MWETPKTLSVLGGRASHSIHGCLNLILSKHASFWAIRLTIFFPKFHLFHASTYTIHSYQQFVPYSSSALLKKRWSNYLELHNYPPSLLSYPSSYTHFSGRWYWELASIVPYFIYSTFLVILWEYLFQIGVISHNYGAHSFHQEGASLALDSGIVLDV